MTKDELDARCKAAFDGCVAALTSDLPDDSAVLPAFVVIVTKPGTTSVHCVASNLKQNANVAETVVHALMGLTETEMLLQQAKGATRQ